MDFDHSPKVRELLKRLSAFMDEHVYPNEDVFLRQLDDIGRWKPVPIVEELKAKAKAAKPAPKKKAPAKKPVAAAKAKAKAKPASKSRRK